MENDFIQKKGVLVHVWYVSKQKIILEALNVKS